MLVSWTSIHQCQTFKKDRKKKSHGHLVKDGQRTINCFSKPLKLVHLHTPKLNATVLFSREIEKYSNESNEHTFASCAEKVSNSKNH